ncbi:MAG: purine-nucleoside phosphorylase [Defluviitaleaceae bacterium]|nr:purine-nucleoside phosphorylase [Defluviitaleaceae bacterium]
MINERINNAYDFIADKGNFSPKVGLILGSGLGDFANTLENPTAIPFGDIPNFPKPTVEGHTGAFVFGKHKGLEVVALQGRIHYYEGYTMEEVTMPVRIMKKFGTHTVIITNAAGGVNESFGAGTLMQITDHINFSGGNPLIGPNIAEFGPRFPDCTNIYTKDLVEKLNQAATKAEITLQKGVYIMFSGPNYETPAEIRFCRTIGADAVGMSTVPEAIVAAHANMRVMGISCVTNAAAGILDQELNHAEVVEVANRVKADFTKLLSLAIEIGSGK